jgi:hypothetical protein
MNDMLATSSFLTEGGVFEMLMLLCFGASWPFSIYRIWKVKQCLGKSLVFVVVVLVGYCSGIVWRSVFEYNWRVFLYALNATMVSVDLALSLKYHRAHRHAAAPSVRPPAV